MREKYKSTLTKGNENIITHNIQHITLLHSHQIIPDIQCRISKLCSTGIFSNSVPSSEAITLNSNFMK